MVEHPKSKSTQPRFARRWATLYNLIEFQIRHDMNLSAMDLRVVRFQIQMGLLLASLLIVLQTVWHRNFTKNNLPSGTE